MLPPLTRCPRPPQVAAYCVSAATSAFWLTLLIKLNWHALPLLHFAQALTTQRFCRRTPYLMGKFWVMLKWYLLITFVGSVCGAIGWSFRTTAGGLNYLLSDPILKVRISRARVAADDACNPPLRKRGTRLRITRCRRRFGKPTRLTTPSARWSSSASACQPSWCCTRQAP